MHQKKDSYICANLLTFVIMKITVYFKKMGKDGTVSVSLKCKAFSVSGDTVTVTALDLVTEFSYYEVRRVVCENM